MTAKSPDAHMACWRAFTLLSSSVLSPGSHETTFAAAFVPALDIHCFLLFPTLRVGPRGSHAQASDRSRRPSASGADLPVRPGRLPVRPEARVKTDVLSDVL